MDQENGSSADLTSTYYIGFLGNAKAGNGVCIDNVVVTEGCCPPTITAHPSPVVTCAGTSASVSIAAGLGLGYQWRKNGTSISGATNPVLTINPVSTSDAGSYDCVVTNVRGADIERGSADGQRRAEHNKPAL